MTKKSRFLLLATFFIVCFEAILGSFLFHYALGYSWSISLIIGFSFATVGEEVLIPILEEFKMINTPLGRSIIGIGILDDIIEIFILVAIIDFVGLSVGNLRIAFIILSIIFLFLLTIWFRKAGEEKLFFRFKRIETLFLFIIFVLFLFLWIGTSIEAGPLAAFLAGISIKTFIPKGKLKVVEKQVKSFAYGFFAPLFFFHVGTAIDFGKIFSSFWLLIAVVFISSFAKILSSVLISIKELSKKEAIALGVGLSSRFSTGIVVIKILLDASLIDVGIYSVIMASGVIITFTVPIVFSLLVKKWKLKN
ncbi:hypothetical protein D6829_01115 [Candidatus Pacearchaeota archaeon]|nr:MAG: hypothetical protein D6829_01115 [Candidatus Pacearchaeota archaeon]